MVAIACSRHDCAGRWHDVPANKQLAATRLVARGTRAEGVEGEAPVVGPAAACDDKTGNPVHKDDSPSPPARTQPSLPLAGGAGVVEGLTGILRQIVKPTAGGCSADGCDCRFTRQELGNEGITLAGDGPACHHARNLH
eukprot:TRINITY_DN41864_c0_g1_i1.p1 TRINITY_DN41864_c0_g1~~TRINITY_DN41864_c0_g1_i1.p1  ORF type:complete len:139 (+),score=9.20 TRINITY_DN41864_c0_g1_i1:113-529(+)